MAAIAALPARRPRAGAAGGGVAALLERFFSRVAPLGPGGGLVVAFSGGADSTALLAGLARLAPRRGWRLCAAHLDHGLDPGSADRCRAARANARRLGVPFVAERRPVGALRRPGESREEAARRVRYGFLEEVRRRRGAELLATAHHADDQVETLLLRLLQGSGLAGLAGIAARRGALVRPLLEADRATLRAMTEEAGLVAVEDPGNADLTLARNRLRRRLLPHLRRAVPGSRGGLLALAGAAAGARAALDRRLAGRLRPRRLDRGAAIDLAALTALAQPLWPAALDLTARRAGRIHPPSAAARRELARQLAAGGRVGCDCGGGWRWRRRGAELRLERRPQAPPAFSYRIPAAGRVELPELAAELRLRPARFAAWMLRGEPRRAGLVLDGDGSTCPAGLRVRSRRPGDRIRPLGAAGSRKLKQVLIDRRVPRAERDRLPLLARGSEILWVPGITIDERCRLRPGAPVWLAEIAPR